MFHVHYATHAPEGRWLRWPRTAVAAGIAVWFGIVGVHPAAYAAEEGTSEPAADTESRSLFGGALHLCERGEYGERTARLLDAAAQMQDRDPDSRGYGNFRWRWGEEKVLDYNAVDFCMKNAPIIWIRHRDKLPDTARQTLLETLKYGAEGCRRHTVPSSYTNIAIMNAADLILLGQALEDPSLQEEGLLRLDRFCEYTRENGISEYCSPTYYRVDFGCLRLLEAFCEDPRGRDQARALLELLSTDVALNWWWPSDRLGGAHSREYNYLYGGEGVNSYLPTEGTVFGQPKWLPSARLRQLSKDRHPRLVRQRWGASRARSRTYFVCSDVGLSSAAANYGPMDLPLTVDLPGKGQPRCYFIPDGRGDPYGTKKIEAGPHTKAHHLRPFWTAAQRGADALGVALYHPGSLSKASEELASHFVMRRDVDGFWIGGRRVDLSGQGTAEFAVGIDEPVVLRLGSAAVGVRVPWAVGISDTPATIALVNDGNDHGAVRLTVTHPGIVTPGDIRGTGRRGRSRPAAAFWIRIGSGLDTEAAFAVWQRDFGLAATIVDASKEHIRIEVGGQDGPVIVGISEPYHKPDAIVPAPTRALLELDGEDIGSEIMKKCSGGRI